MTDETDSFTWTRKDMQRADRVINAVEHQILGFPSVRRQIASPQTTGVQVMVVTEVQQDAAFGLRENMFVDAAYQQPAATGSASAFKAKPWQEDARTLTDLDGDEVYVDCSTIPSVLFTGQMFLMSSSGIVRPGTVTINGETFDVTGVYIAGGLGNRWNGKFDGRSRMVDVKFFQQLGNPTATRANTCRVSAYNATGTTLVDGQIVVLDYMATNPPSSTGAAYNRWQITDYSCAIPTGELFA